MARETRIFCDDCGELIMITGDTDQEDYYELFEGPDGEDLCEECADGAEGEV